MRIIPGFIARFAAAGALMASAASACLPPEPMPRLPNESDQAYDARNGELTSVEDAEGRRFHQVSLYEQAKAVFIGVVTDSKEITLADSGSGHEVTVRPAFPIKGELPEQPAIIRDKMNSDCGYLGGGSATSAVVGTYVLLFQGVPEYEGVTGNVGFFAGEARVPEIIKAFRSFKAPAD